MRLPHIEQHIYSKSLIFQVPLIGTIMSIYAKYYLFHPSQMSHTVGVDELYINIEFIGKDSSTFATGLRCEICRYKVPMEGSLLGCDD